MVHVRPSAGADARFLEQMLAFAADWQPGVQVRPVDELLREPSLAHYVSGWPRVGDFGVVAVAERPVGGAWWRYFTRDDPGFGFVDEQTPEVSIGVVPAERGHGIGTLLLDALIEEARHRSVRVLCLSVEVENPAARLYERLGFVPIKAVDGALTLVRHLDR